MGKIPDGVRFETAEAEQQARRAEQARLSRADASCCCRCRQPIAKADPVWLVSCRFFSYAYAHAGLLLSHDTTGAACRECGETELTRERERRRHDPTASVLCHGACVCGRTVWALVHCTRHASFLCSDRCRNRLYGSRFRRRHPPPPRRQPIVTCQVCRRNFAPQRADAKTCSPACRQKAYRSRERVTDGSQDFTG